MQGFSLVDGHHSCLKTGYNQTNAQVPKAVPTKVEEPKSTGLHSRRINYGSSHDIVDVPEDLHTSLPASTAPLQSNAARPSRLDNATGRGSCNDLVQVKSTLPSPHPAAFCQEPSHIHHGSIRNSDTLLRCSSCRKFTSCIRCLTTSSHALRNAQNEVFKYPAKTLAPLCDSCAIPMVAELRLDTSNNCTCPTRLRV
jgi:hypothetical protein